MDKLPGQVGPLESGGVNPTDIIINEPSLSGEEKSYGLVGLDELAKTDRILVQQLAEYAEAACSCACGYEGENEFEVTDRFGHQIFLAEEDSSCCMRQCFESLRGFEMKLMDRQGKVAVVIDRPMRCDNCLICPCLTQTMTVHCPPGVLAGHVEQALSLFKPTYVIKDSQDEDRYVIEGPTSLCSCFMACCHCCASRDIIFRIVDIKTDRQVGSISKKWNGILKEVLTKADRFSLDFPPDIDVGMKATLLAATFLIDYLHFEADPTDNDNEETP